MSLAALPEVTFCETDAANIEQSVITTYEGITGTSLYAGNPVRLFLEGLAAIIIQQRQAIDFAGKQNLLKYSQKDHLDHLGVFSETARLQESKAQTVVRFSMDTPLNFAVSIVAGTRVSPDGKLFFETLAHAEVSIGDTHIDVTVECQTPGEIGNGFVAGQVAKLVDPVAYITGVSNVSISSGGADLETDDRYRERIHTAPESFSVAGPTGAYKHWAMSAHQDIVDVCVESPSGGNVTVTPLMKNGGIPDQTILDLVSSAVSDKTIRPLTDNVSAAAPGTMAYNINLTYYIGSDNSLAVTEIKGKVDQAISDYVGWQQDKLGRNINPDRLIHGIIGAGARRVTIVSPTYSAINNNYVARVGAQTVVYGGIENE